MADKQARKKAAANQEDARYNYDSAKVTIRRATIGGEIFHERICRVYGMKGENLDRREDSKLSRKENTMMGHLRSGHQPELKYWLHKIECAVDTISRKCGVGEETAEHIVYDCPKFRHTSERSQKGSENIGEVDLHHRPTRFLTARNRHRLIYQSSLSPPHPPICPSGPILHNARISFPVSFTPTPGKAPGPTEVSLELIAASGGVGIQVMEGRKAM